MPSLSSSSSSNIRPMPRPILKPCPQPGPMLPPQLEPNFHVHFPCNAAALERHYVALGRHEYDRSTIRVMQNTCALPERGCPGRTYDAADSYPSSSRDSPGLRRKACKNAGKTVHPSSLYGADGSTQDHQFLDELAFYFDDDHHPHQQHAHHHHPQPPSPPPLMRQNSSSESSDDSDSHLSTPPELDPRHFQLAMAYHASNGGGSSSYPLPFSTPYEPPPISMAHYSVSASYPPSQHDNDSVDGALAFLPHAPKKKKSSKRLSSRVQLPAASTQSFAPWGVEEGCLGGF